MLFPVSLSVFDAGCKIALAFGTALDAEHAQHDMLSAVWAFTVKICNDKGKNKADSRNNR